MVLMIADETERVRDVFTRRSHTVNLGRYSPFDPAHFLLHQSRQSAFLEVLKHCGIRTMKGLRVLDIGCGAGETLLEYLLYDAHASDLFGVDLLPEQLSEARTRLPHANWVCANAGRLPFPDCAFDLVTQYTVLSSVLDDAIRQCLASEMIRVVKPDGLVISYDFWPNNPANLNVRGLTAKELRLLFPHTEILVKRLVLAPPISRRVAPISTLTCHVLEKLPWLCSHELVGIIPDKVSVVQRNEGGTPKAQIISSILPVEIRSATQDDVQQIVAVHLRSFPGFFLSFLGPRFLTVLYTQMLRSSEGLVLVACSGGQVDGFVAGATSQTGFYRRLISEQLAPFFLASMSAFLRSPRVGRKLLRALKVSDEVRQASAPACLMSIAVLPERQGNQIGQRLVTAFCQGLVKRGIHQVCLTTDREHNDRTNSFYRRLGFDIARFFVTPEGRVMNEYYMHLDGENQQEGTA
jgi:ubiquinone/menaquinone biosynthesis C-methylase UbiE/ribosomal protein S18 acetylase RimI-like enzyme